jgi:hypothetical protein
MAQEGLLLEYWPPTQTGLYIKFTYYSVVLGEGKMEKQLFQCCCPNLENPITNMQLFTNFPFSSTSSHMDKN